MNIHFSAMQSVTQMRDFHVIVRADSRRHTKYVWRIEETLPDRCVLLDVILRATSHEEARSIAQEKFTPFLKEELEGGFRKDLVSIEVQEIKCGDDGVFAVIVGHELLDNDECPMDSLSFAKDSKELREAHYVCVNLHIPWQPEASEYKGQCESREVRAFLRLNGHSECTLEALKDDITKRVRGFIKNHFYEDGRSEWWHLEQMSIRFENFARSWIQIAGENEETGCGLEDDEGYHQKVLCPVVPVAEKTECIKAKGANNDEPEIMKDPSTCTSPPDNTGEDEYTGEGEGWDSRTSYPKRKHPDSEFATDCATESKRATGTQEKSPPNLPTYAPISPSYRPDSPAYSPTSPPYVSESPPPGDADPSRSPAY